MKIMRSAFVILAAAAALSFGLAGGYAQMAGLGESLAIYDAKNREVGKVVGFVLVGEPPKPPRVAPKAPLPRDLMPEKRGGASKAPGVAPSLRQKLDQLDLELENREEPSKPQTLAPVVLFKTGKSWVPLVVSRSALSQLTATDVQPTVFFESTNCTGAPLVQPLPERDSLIPRVEFIVDKAYVQDLQAKIRKVSARSFLVSDGKIKQCSPGGGNLDLAPAKLVDFKFTPPFTIR